MNENWCNHIEVFGDGERWIFVDKNKSYCDSRILVSENWNYCPICGNKKPKESP